MLRRKQHRLPRHAFEPDAWPERLPDPFANPGEDEFTPEQLAEATASRDAEVCARLQPGELMSSYDCATEQMRLLATSGVVHAMTLDQAEALADNLKDHVAVMRRLLGEAGA